jgi:hypothetical protein
MNEEKIDIHDYSNIDISNAKIETMENSAYKVQLDKTQVTDNAFFEIIEYIYTDRVK